MRVKEAARVRELKKRKLNGERRGRYGDRHKRKGFCCGGGTGG